MEYESLTDREKEIWNYAFDLGVDAEVHEDVRDEAWNAGYAEGYQDCIDAMHEDGITNDNYDDGYHNGYLQGKEDEQKRIQDVLGMMFESSLNMGKGKDAIWYRNMIDLLTPIDLKDIEDEDF